MAQLLLLLALLSPAIASYAYHPGAAFMARLGKERDVYLVETLEGIFDRAARWHANGGANSPLNDALRAEIEAHGAAAARRRDSATAPPIEYSPNPDPNPIVIPAGAPTITVGRTWPQTSGNSETPYGLLAETGFRTAERLINGAGGILFNGVKTYLQYATYNDGSDCNLMIILYERLITLDDSTFLHTPVNYDCSIVALVAEAYRIPLLNTADYTMPVLMDTDPVYESLQWTWDLSPNYWTQSASCIEAVHTRGARTVVGFETPAAPGYAAQAVTAAAQYSMTVPINGTFSVDEAAGTNGWPNLNAYTGNCTYFDPFIDEFIEKNVDVLYGTALDATEPFMTCFYRKKYRPRALILITGYTANEWQSDGVFSPNSWLEAGTFLEPYLGTAISFSEFYYSIWGTASGSPAYPASHATGTEVGLYSIILAGSTDPDAMAAILDNTTYSTLSGPAYLINDTRHFYHPYYCTQVFTGNITNVVYPPNAPNVTSAVFPYNITFPADFLATLKNPSGSVSQRAKIGLGIGLGGLGLILIILAVVAVVMQRRYHFVFISKNAARSGTWDTDGSVDERGGGIALPCCRT